VWSRSPSRSALLAFQLLKPACYALCHNRRHNYKMQDARRYEMMRHCVWLVARRSSSGLVQVFVVARMIYLITCENLCGCI
jgi:hypothetical protein